MNRVARGTVIATAVAGLFMAGAVPARAADKAGGDAVHCAGVNSCKGKGECAGAKHDCGGKNACKGQGWQEMSAADCKAKGGTVEKE